VNNMVRTCKILLLSFFALLVGCKTIKSPPRSNLVYLDKGNLSKVDGYYRNDKHGTGYDSYSIWEVINLLKYKIDRPLYDSGTDLVHLKAIDEKTLIAQLRRDGVLIKERRIKGHLKNGYFITRGKERFRGVPFILWTDIGTSYKIGLDNEDNLLIDGVYSRGGGFLIFTAGSHDSYNLSFKKDSLAKTHR